MPTHAIASNVTTDRIIRPRELAGRIGLSLATIWRLRQRGDLPEPRVLLRIDVDGKTFSFSTPRTNQGGPVNANTDAMKRAADYYQQYACRQIDTRHYWAAAERLSQAALALSRSAKAAAEETVLKGNCPFAPDM